MWIQKQNHDRWLKTNFSKTPFFWRAVVLLVSNAESADFLRVDGYIINYSDHTAKNVGFTTIKFTNLLHKKGCKC